MSNLPTFLGSSFPTMGVELELQLINLFSFNLAMEANDFLRRLSERNYHEQIKPEITQSMIELNTSVHKSYNALKTELVTIRDVVAREAQETHIGVCGGGAHPFQKWKAQRIFQTERFAGLSEQYGYLAKQFTVFGQHVHIACPSGDDALYLCHAFANFIPHFIALSAASPFQQGVDTSFDCSRLGIISAFPLSGTPPWVLTWNEFEEYFEKLFELDVIQSMKDFYWDIRPKPEFGTIELRISDTPLTVEKAADIGAYAQMLVYYLLEAKPEIHREIYYTYLINRFRAARYGFDAQIVDPKYPTPTLLADDILKTCEILTPYATKLNSEEALNNILQATKSRVNGSTWLRINYAEYKSFEDTVRSQTEIWMCD